MKELVKCPNCGKNNKIIAKFCENCGTALDDVTNVSKQSNIQRSERSTKPVNIFDQMKSFWNARDKKGKAITGIAVCCLGVIILAAIGGALSPDKNLISMGIYGVTYDGPGAYHVEINNSTTEYVINGYVESGANLTVSSSDLNISAQRVNLTSNNSFQYKVKIPTDVNSAKVRFEAVKVGKEDTYFELTIKKPSVESSTTTQSTQPALKHYSGNGFSLDYPSSWQVKPASDIGTDCALYLVDGKDVELNVWFGTVGYGDYDEFKPADDEISSERSAYTAKIYEGTEVSENIISENGVEGYRIVFLCNKNPLETVNAPMYLDEKMLTKGNKGRELSLFVSKDYYEQNKDLINKVVDSFQIN